MERSVFWAFFYIQMTSELRTFPAQKSRCFSAMHGNLPGLFGAAIIYSILFAENGLVWRITVQKAGQVGHIEKTQMKTPGILRKSMI